MSIEIKEYSKEDIKEAIAIWNEVVIDGVAFPQITTLDETTGDEFFKSQSYTGLAYDSDNNEILGLYILHPNNIGRCGHIANTSYAVSKHARGKHVGESIVKDSLVKAKSLGFKILQFNAVVKSNTVALNLYKKLGFTQLGEIPNGFKLDNGNYETIIPHYKTL